MGGGTAWRAALLQPERVAGLLLLNASGAQGGEPVTPFIGARIASTWLGQKLLPRLSPRFLISASLEDSIADSDLINAQMIDRYWHLVRYPGNRQAKADAIAQGQETRLWQQIGQIKVPSLIVWGQLDGVIPVSNAALFDSALPESKLVIYDDIGHY